MLIENNWLNMLVHRSENKGYIIQAHQVWFGNRVPGHLGIVFIDGEIFSIARQPPVVQDLLIIEASRSHSDTPHSVGLLLTRDQP
jgi:hypothetical protein